MNRWTKEEDNCLRNHTLPPTRTYQASRRRAKAIGVKLLVGFGSKWTAEEIALAMQGIKPKGRSAIAVKGKLKYIKKKETPWTTKSKASR